jgi:hypothetical protein
MYSCMMFIPVWLCNCLLEFVYLVCLIYRRSREPETLFSWLVHGRCYDRQLVRSVRAGAPGKQTQMSQRLEYCVKN